MQKPKQPQSEDVLLPLPSATDTSAKLSTPLSKAKIKTRGEPGTPEVGNTDVGDLTVDLESTKIDIKLPKRALATFRCMFPATVEEHQKNIDWNTFVDSTSDAGFTASNGGGSMVTFENVVGKIIFHRPHPELSIDPIMLQSMGNRMNVVWVAAGALRFGEEVMVWISLNQQHLRAYYTARY
ncbi:hypothetical protein C7974DRAFT_455400 [Boeremia exigua]|uniref:uncharacterized protein n=1 Tax=Boeremia exigua TaxID=749465 RepID=UPI001E8E1415|nr:uncharacterized protein C7974DRAFT_455400 [Boeremia exigua]KAH6625374.1 hypothetical protein C7974DRAFT_455400 [Boeremia exigua]